jgi:hypothetical protein
MLRRYVCLAAALSAVACTEAADPVAERAVTFAVARTSAGELPFDSDAHVSAIPAFDNSPFLPTAFNDWGEIVGDSGGGTIPTVGTVFKWQVQRGLRTLHVPVDSFTLAQAVAVNDHGQVAITLSTPNAGADVFRTAIWDWFGNVKILRPLSSQSRCGAAGINNEGVLLGTCTVGANFTGVPTVWTPFGTPDALHLGGGSQVVTGGAIAISDSGYIFGAAAGGKPARV